MNCGLADGSIVALELILEEPTRGYVMNAPNVSKKTERVTQANL